MRKRKENRWTNDLEVLTGDRIKSTDVGGNLEQKGKGTHDLLSPEGGREGWLWKATEDVRAEKVSTMSFFIKQQVKSFAKRWWAEAGWGGLRRGECLE